MSLFTILLYTSSHGDYYESFFWEFTKWYTFMMLNLQRKNFFFWVFMMKFSYHVYHLRASNLVKDIDCKLSFQHKGTWERYKRSTNFFSISQPSLRSMIKANDYNSKISNSSFIFEMLYSESMHCSIFLFVQMWIL